MHLQSTADPHRADEPSLLAPLDDRDGFCPQLDRFTSLLAFVVALAGIALSCVAALSQAGARHGGGLALTSRGIALGAGGIAASLILGTFLVALGRSRAHAVTLARASSRELRHRLLHDAMTGLPNDRLAVAHAEQMLAAARLAARAVTALHVDLDGFCELHDSLGHSVADELLRMVAERLAGVLPAGAMLARIGHDTFLVLLDGFQAEARPELLAERLLEELRRPYVLRGHRALRVSLTASIGIAAGLPPSPVQLIRESHVALTAAKKAGGNRLRIYHDAMGVAVRERLALHMDLVDALHDEQLFVLYQPVLDLTSESIVGAEALVRWRHPSRGLVGPSEFIPLAEESDLIVDIGRWVLREACRQVAAWRRERLAVTMAVNLSARQLESGSVVEDVRHALADARLPGDALVLELTETALMQDPAANSERLDALRGLGVKIAIDDFGTGYSSLGYLRLFHADLLKIDGSFVAGLATSRDAATLIQLVIELAHRLGLQTLAEGIEHAEQLECLRQLGCALGQGYLFAPPLSAQEIRRLLDSRLRRDRSAEHATGERDRDQLSTRARAEARHQITHVAAHRRP